MKLHSYIKTGINNLLTGKLRTVLTILGILVGTASVVALLSSGNLATDAALQQFKDLGMNLMSISFYPQQQLQQRENQNTRKITSARIMPLESENLDIRQVAPYIVTYAAASFGKKSWNANIIGATQNLASVVGATMQQGRFINKLDKSNYFCIVGHDTAAENLPLGSILGKRIKLGRLIFTVIGVTNTWRANQFFPIDVNTSIIVPLDTIPFFSAQADISNVVMSLQENANIDVVKEKINGYFDKNIPGYQVNIQSARELIKSMSAQHNIFTLLLGTIGGISLFVGGIGVMNIMLAAVAERRHEIGLRLALGAQPEDIQKMFLVEAILLAVAGGGSGVVLGLVCTYIVSSIAGWPFTIFLMPVIIGFSVSVLICVFFGLYPAYKASRLDPIGALREE